MTPDVAVDGASAVENEFGFCSEQSLPRLPIVRTGGSVPPARPAWKLARLRPDAASGGPGDVLG